MKENSEAAMWSIIITIMHSGKCNRSLSSLVCFALLCFEAKLSLMSCEVVELALS